MRTREFLPAGLTGRRAMGAAGVLFLVLSMAVLGCGGSAGGKRDGKSAGETIYVEGELSLRGSQPFPLLLLEGRDGRVYMIASSPVTDELKSLQDMPIGLNAKILPDIRGEAPALAVESYDLLALPTGERPVVGIIIGASLESVTMRAEDNSIWVLEGDFKTVFLGLEGAKIWVVGDRKYAVNTGGDNIRSILVTDYGIIRVTLCSFPGIVGKSTAYLSDEPAVMKDGDSLFVSFELPFEIRAGVGAVARPESRREPVVRSKNRNLRAMKDNGTDIAMRTPRSRCRDRRPLSPSGTRSVRAAYRDVPRHTLKTHPTQLDPPIIGSSATMQRLRQAILRLADAPSNVLVTGESGTGKELVARNLHTCSSRRAGPFVPVNCAALNPGILESELFGHGKGSFTGAVQSYAGLFEQADGGTLFLDEIGEIPSSIQAKLLRVLEDREIRRMGTSHVRRVDVRVVSATNVDIEERIEKGEFRLDLYYRLSVLAIRVPPLRERAAEIPELVDHFIEARGCAPRALGDDALSILTRYPWPGNVRELQNEVERLVVLHPGAAEVAPGMISDRIAERGAAGRLDVNLLYEYPLPRAVGYLEENLVRKTLARTNWNKSRTARELGLSRQGLLKKIKRYGIEREGGGSDGPA